MEGSFFTFHARDTGNAPSLRASTPAGHQTESPKYKYKYKYKCKYEYKYKYKIIGPSPHYNAIAIPMYVKSVSVHTVCTVKRKSVHTVYD